MNFKKWPKSGRVNNTTYQKRYIWRILALTFCLMVLILLIISYLNFDQEISSVSFDEVKFQDYEWQKVHPFKGKKFVHIDLKGAPPKVEYYEVLFPLLSELGADGLLLEYEDMFPYNDKIKNISALNSYSKKSISRINELAKKNNLEIIPLIQTFGHMEFILKLPDYKSLREVPRYPQSICPSQKESLKLIKWVLTQVIEAHPDSGTIHIGCDEVYHYGECDLCQLSLQTNKWTRSQLFLEHVKTVAKMARNINPKIKVLIWDDILRNIDPEVLIESKINEYAIPVVWKYTKDVYDDLGPSLWTKYVGIFNNLWIASAFKGATSSNEYITDSLYYVENHRSWLRVISEFKNKVNFEGVLITGWQRFDHFAVLCELLPVAIPSLAMCLRQLSGQNDSPINPPLQIATKLQCENPYALIGPAFGNPSCKYPGYEILEELLNLKKIKEEYDLLLEDSKVRGWMNDFNIIHEYTNVELIDALSTQVGRLKYQIGLIELNLVKSLKEIYDNYTIYEWTKTYLVPLRNKIDDMWDAKEKLVLIQEWSRRPINFNHSEFKR